MIPREYRLPIFGLAFACVLWMTSMYQLEIVFIGATSGWGHFDMPFYLFGPLSFAVARDIFYLVNAISLVTATWCGAVFNVKRMELRLRGKR